MVKYILVQTFRLMVGHPTEERFKHILSSKLLNNLPIKVEDVTKSHTILGPDLTGVQGKSAVHKPDMVDTYLILIPRYFCEL